MKDNINEVKWQRALQPYTKSHKSFISQNKTHINILSLGTHNCFEGPDFHNACLQINGQLLVGDVEFHKQSSDWIAHHHQHDPNYSNVILHIVFEENKQLNATFETVIISKAKLTPYLKSTNKVAEPAITNEEYKYYAMLRLLRRTEEVFNNLRTTSFDFTFSTLLDNFLLKYNSFRLRPRDGKYNSSGASQNGCNFFYIKDILQDSSVMQWLRIKGKFRYNISLLFNDFINNSPNFRLNRHLKQELVTNVLLPLCFCMASRTAKTELLLWYWSVKTRAKYGILNRLYPAAEQKYIWQQQGMLEHYKEYYKRQTSDVIDFLKDGEVSDYINYFELAKQPYSQPRLSHARAPFAVALSLPSFPRRRESPIIHDSTLSQKTGDSRLRGNDTKRGMAR